MSRDEQERLRDIKDAITAIRAHLSNAGETSAAKADPLLHDALLFQFVVIGASPGRRSRSSKRRPASKYRRATSPPSAACPRPKPTRSTIQTETSPTASPSASWQRSGRETLVRTARSQSRSDSSISATFPTPFTPPPCTRLSYWPPTWTRASSRCGRRGVPDGMAFEPRGGRFDRPPGLVSSITPGGLAEVKTTVRPV